MTSTSQMTWCSSHTTATRCRISLYTWQQHQQHLGSGNKKKTELMKINTIANMPVTVDREPIKEVESFLYLGRVINREGCTDQDVTARICKA